MGFEASDIYHDSIVVAVPVHIFVFIRQNFKLKTELHIWTFAVQHE